MLARILTIGVLHLVLYGVVVPFVIYPRFGEKGSGIAVAIILILTLGIMASLGLGKNRKGEKNENP